MNGEQETRIERFNRYSTACLETDFSADEDLKIKDTYTILQVLTDMPNNKINSARSNHSKLDRDGMTYHLIKLCLRLFVAGLHTETPCDKNGFPDPEYNFRTRYLEKRLKEPMEENRRLQRQIDKLESADDKIALRKLREQVLDHQSELAIKTDYIKKLEEQIAFKDDQLKNSVSKKRHDAVVKALKDFEESLEK